MEKDF
jgi:hypothetical protein